MTSAKKSADTAAEDEATTAATTTVATTTGAELVPGGGSTTIADTVVEKIAGISAREVPGVHNLGRGTSRALGAVRERIPGAKASYSQGVRVEVGQRQAAIDLELVVEYGINLTDLAEAVRGNVIANIEQMTALEVTEVNLVIDDIFIPGDDDGDDGRTGPSRVQ